MQKQDFVVRFAGEGGQGVVTSVDALAQIAAQVGYHVRTFATFPSQILGGPTWTQAKISTVPALTPGDELDLLVAFNSKAYEAHKTEVRDGGVILYNSESFQIDDGDHTLPIPIDELAKSTGNSRAGNMVILGAIAHLINMPQEFLNQFVIKRFTRGRENDATIIESNIKAIDLGRKQASITNLSLGDLSKPEPRVGEQILIKGNDSLSLGAIAAGLNFYVGYPISPATTILTFMEQNLIGKEKFVYQVSSEIESITAILGASFSGRKSMTATAGPGFSLMSEGLGLGWMAEIPVVVVNVQRGGPSTGLPTKTEQSDLLSCLYPTHGDVRLPVIAPGTVEECFYGAIQAFNWAERYQGPVILLSEMSLAEQARNIPKPDVAKLIIENRQVYKGTNGYKRYEGSELTPMPIPGNPGAYVANGSEHDPIGDTTHLPNRHLEMTERRFNKLKLLNDGTYECENPEHAIAIMPWGGSKGASKEAFKSLSAMGTPICWLYTMYLHPLPTELLEILRSKELVLVPELNYQGQFATILRSQGVNAQAITQYNGLPFKTKDLLDRVSEIMKSSIAGTIKI